MTNRNESRRPRAQAVGLDTHAVICDHGRRRVAPPLVIRPEGPGCARLRALTLSHAVGVLRLPQFGQARQVDRFRFRRVSTSVDSWLSTLMDRSATPWWRGRRTRRFSTPGARTMGPVSTTIRRATTARTCTDSSVRIRSTRPCSGPDRVRPECGWSFVLPPVLAERGQRTCTRTSATALRWPPTRRCRRTSKPAGI